MTGSAPLEVAVVGAGLSGVCAGAHLRRAGRAFALFEARDAIGGTWDLFRYPGVRSDSDMATLGYAFRPWTGEKALADGPSILAYVRETAEAEGLAPRFGHRLVAADWDGAAALWRLDFETAGGPVRVDARFLYLCTGYYDYEAGHAPRFAGRDDFAGRVIHPQHWPEDYDWTGQRIAVIGSGATAVTLVPELARRAAHVTMVQRTPTYVMAMPGRDGLADRLRRWLGDARGHAATRWKNILLTMAFYQAAQRAPRLSARLLTGGAAKASGLDPAHFAPPYDPWDQRLCLVPDGDLFDALRAGDAGIVTGAIDRFVPEGLRMEDGRVVEADAVVTATGLSLRIAGGAALSLDGAPVNMADHVAYKGVMYAGLPNLAVALGYTNASWTLKCELIARYVVRLLDHMEARGHDWAVPQAPPAGEALRTTFELSSGYLERSRDLIPKQTARAPWRMLQNYLLDRRLLGRGRVDDHMDFGRAPARGAPRAAA